MTPGKLEGVLPGDVLLFARGGFFNRVIQIKTWSAVSHVEVVCRPPAVFFRGRGKWTFNVVASRNGEGVGLYEPDLKGLHTVLRPIRHFQQRYALDWFWVDANRQGYDWLGLLAFFNAKRQGKENQKMFCSELAARYLRAGGIDPFNGADADAIAPSDFLKNSAFRKLELVDGKVIDRAAAILRPGANV